MMLIILFSVAVGFSLGSILTMLNYYYFEKWTVFDLKYAMVSLLEDVEKYDDTEEVKR